ncbi:MAG: hypothetical protein ACM3ZE_02540 [Myxococcales bacterium]
MLTAGAAPSERGILGRTVSPKTGWLPPSGIFSMRQNPPPSGDSSQDHAGTGPITVEPVVPLECGQASTSWRDDKSTSELRLNRSSQPPAQANRDYNFVRDEPGALEATTAISGSSDPVPPPASERDGRRWSLVPSPVIDVEGLNRGPTRPARPFSTTVSGLQPIVLGPDPVPSDNGASAGTLPSVTSPNNERDRTTAAAPAFNPSRAYPNAPAARPFIPGAQTPNVTGELPFAHTWKFRGGIMIIPGLGASVAAAIVLMKLPVWVWAIAGTCVWFGLIASGVLLHRAWSSINDQQSRTTPARAVALLFVPIFNIYWAFNVIPGFATDYNRFIERHQVEARPISRNLLLAAMVPVIGVVFCWVGISAICRAINSVRTNGRTSEPAGALQEQEMDASGTRE